MTLCRGHPLVGIRLVYNGKAQESVSVAVLPFEASRIAHWKSDGNAEAHACICKRCIRLNLSREKPKAEYYIPTGIYRCSILDSQLKFCENFERSRISADKRFQNVFLLHPAPLNPRPGLQNGLQQQN